MYCPNCGNNVNDNSKFCTKCGTSINGPQAKQNVEPVQPKKNTGCLVATVIGIILLFIIPFLIFFGVFSLAKKLVTDSPDIECCLGAGGTWKDGTCKDYNKEKYNKCMNESSEDDEERATTLNKQIKKYVEQFNKNITTTEATVEEYKGTEKQKVTYKINSDKQVERIVNNEKTIENLNGEKAKYIIGTNQNGSGTTNYCTSIYVLTEEGNIYYMAAGLDRDEMKKIETNYKFKNMLIIPTTIDGERIIDANNLYNYIPIVKAYGQFYLAIGVTEQDELVTINTYYPFLNIGKTNKYLVMGFSIYDDRLKIDMDNGLRAFESIVLFNDGSLNYTTANQVVNLYNDKNLYTNFHNKENVYNEKEEIINANFVFKDNNNTIYIISDDNQMYQLTTDKLYEIKNSSDNDLTSITIPYYKDTNTKVSKIKTLEKDKDGVQIRKAEIEFKDGTNIILEGYGLSLYE